VSRREQLRWRCDDRVVGEHWGSPLSRPDDPSRSLWKLRISRKNPAVTLLRSRGTTTLMQWDLFTLPTRPAAALLRRSQMTLGHGRVS